VRAPLWLACIIGCQIGSVLADVPKKDPRLAKRPAVLAPICGSPSPYLIENWNSDALEFFVVLKEGIPASTAHVLAAKHHFEIDGIPNDLGPRATFAVLWLEPIQVAALRCESSVKHIEFNKIAYMD